MASGLYTKRDFQVAEEMAWHNLTTIATPTREAFPEIIPVPLQYTFNDKTVAFFRAHLISEN
jgi:hypothetical protein